MTRTCLLLLSLLAIPLGAWSMEAQEPQEDTRPGIGVMPFYNGGSHGDDAEAEDYEALEIGLQQMLLTELSMNTSLRIVERGRLQEIMAEQDLVTEGRIDPQTAAEVGRIVGARYMVLGAFTDIQGQFRMDARIVDSETSELITATRVFDDRDQIYDLLVQLAGQITNGVDLPPLPEPQREARREREIPPEAVTLYSRAQVYEDAGRTEQAITLYRRITQEFPDMEEARQALTQLSG